MADNKPNWPTDARFCFFDLVERAEMSSGKPPAYRFPGSIVGWYATLNGYGYAVSRDGDPGCVQIFPEYMLKRR